MSKNSQHILGRAWIIIWGLQIYLLLLIWANRLKFVLFNRSNLPHMLPSYCVVGSEVGPWRETLTCQLMTSHLLLVLLVLNGSVFWGKMLSLLDFFFCIHASFNNNVLRGYLREVMWLLGNRVLSLESSLELAPGLVFTEVYSCSHLILGIRVWIYDFLSPNHL